MKFMPRKSQESALREQVQAYLTLAEGHLPEESPIDVQSVAAALKVSRTTIYKYGLEQEIRVAAERQQKRAKLSGTATERYAYADMIRQLRQNVEQEQERNKKLVERLVIVQANAGRLNIDLEELFKPLPKPNRTISHASRGAKKPRN
jgi:hypothetical protein